MKFWEIFTHFILFSQIYVGVTPHVLAQYLWALALTLVGALVQLRFRFVCKTRFAHVTGCDVVVVVVVVVGGVVVVGVVVVVGGVVVVVVGVVVVV